MNIEGNEVMLYMENRLLQNGLFNNISYYSGSKSKYIKICKYKVGRKILSKSKKLEISCTIYSDLVKEKGLINGQIIDSFAVSYSATWNENTIYIPTDDTLRILEDYSTKRRIATKRNLSTYSINVPLKNILLLPYVHNFYWRLVIINIEKETFTTLDPFLEEGDVE